MYSWGHNTYGELGIGSTTNQPSPKPITTLNDQVITKVRNTRMIKKLKIQGVEATKSKGTRNKILE